MRKVILIIAGLVLVASGVAAVSAYEAHTINVRATVENAITVSPDEDWLVGEEDGGNGTIFPQEFFTKHYEVSLSNSFIAQKWGRDGYGYIQYDEPGRVNQVVYNIVAEEKLLLDPTPELPYSGDETYYAWMGEFVKTGVNLVDNRLDVTGKGLLPQVGTGDGINFADTDWALVDAKPTSGPGVGPPAVVNVIIGEKLGLQDDGLDQLDSFTLSIGVDAPVFQNYYNYWSDVCPKPNGLDVPTWEILDTDDRHNNGQGTDFGIDIKIQVTGITHIVPDGLR